MALAQYLNIADRVTFAGQQHDIPTWLAAFDIFALSSNWEGMSNALLEAMATQLPVVATAVGGTPEVVVDSETGLLIPPRDPDALAQAIARLLRNPDLRDRMGQAGRKRIKRYFSIVETIRRTEGLYTTLLQEKGY